jgi:hypothetical protein
MGKIGYNPLFADGKTLADIMREVRFREKRKNVLFTDIKRKITTLKKVLNEKKQK